jgi:hypothetical protein
LLLTGTILCGVSLILYAIFNELGNVSLQSLGVILYILIFSPTLGSVVWLYIPEIVPDVGIGLAILVNWGTNFTVVTVFSFTAVYGVAANMIVFALFSCLGAIFVATCIKETRNKTEAEITAMFEPKNADADEVKEFIS